MYNSEGSRASSLLGERDDQELGTVRQSGAGPLPFGP